MNFVDRDFIERQVGRVIGVVGLVAIMFWVLELIRVLKGS